MLCLNTDPVTFRSLVFSGRLSDKSNVMICYVIMYLPLCECKIFKKLLYFLFQTFFFIVIKYNIEFSRY